MDIRMTPDRPLQASSTDHSQPAIEVRDLVKRFGDFTAVDGISFDVRHGEIFGFLGPNGAGKSTTIRVLTTLLTPTAGVARINGYDLRTQEREVRYSIGVIPQAMTSDVDDGGATAPLVLDAARHHGQRVVLLTVKSTTIDDVFLYYTGAQLGA